MATNRKFFKTYTIILFGINMIACLVYKEIRFNPEKIMTVRQMVLCSLVYISWISIYIYIDSYFDTLVKHLEKIKPTNIINILNLSIFNFSLILLINKFVESKNREVWLMNFAKYPTYALIFIIALIAIKKILTRQFSIRTLIFMLIFIYFIWDFTYLDYFIFLIILMINRLNNISKNNFIILLFMIISSILNLNNIFLLVINLLMILEWVIIHSIGGKKNEKDL